MHRPWFLWPLLALALFIGVTLPSWAAPLRDDVPPLVFELSIDGETFLIEPEKQVDLKSKDRPGTIYKVALRLAQRQRWVLNNIRFEYDGAFRVDDDNETATRTATLTHELGFSLAVIDLGVAPTPTEAPKILEQLSGSLAASYKQGGATEVTVLKPVDKKFGKSAGKEVRIDYVDRNKKKSTTLIALIPSGKQAGACVLNFPTEREADIVSLAKVTLETIAAK